MTILSVPIEALRMVWPFAGRGDIRYYLNGIHIEPCADGGCLLVATNGHTMGVYHSTAAHIDQIRILEVTPGLAELLEQPQEDPGSAICDVCGNVDIDFDQTPRARTVTVEDLDSRVVVRDAHQREAYIQPGKPFIDGKFPTWRKVVPEPEKLVRGSPAWLQGRYLADLNRIPGRSVGTNAVQLWSVGDLHGVCVARFEFVPDLVVLIMPLNYEVPTSWPAWMNWRTEPSAPAPADPPAPESPTIDELPTCASGACEA